MKFINSMLFLGYGWPEGGPWWKCADGVPFHGADPQTSDPPFEITASTAVYTPGSPMTCKPKGGHGRCGT